LSIVETGKSYVEKRRVRYNEPGQPRELNFSAIVTMRSWGASGRASGFIAVEAPKLL